MMAMRHAGHEPPVAVIWATFSFVLGLSPGAAMAADHSSTQPTSRIPRDALLLPPDSPLSSPPDRGSRSSAKR